jgi:hypothetical protein
MLITLILLAAVLRVVPRLFREQSGEVMEAVSRFLN